MSKSSSYIKRYVRQLDGSLKLQWLPYPTSFDFGDSVTDKSKYKPNVPLYSQVTSDARLPSNLVYDFPDGKDTGLDLTPLRNKSLDVVEISALKRSLERDWSKIRDRVEKELDSDESVSSPSSDSQVSGDGTQ